MSLTLPKNVKGNLRGLRADEWFDVIYGGWEEQPHAMAARVQEGLEELSHIEGGDEIPLVQGKEHWLHFAGAAVKRYPMPKVRETQVRR